MCSIGLTKLIDWPEEQLNVRSSFTTAIVLHGVYCLSPREHFLCNSLRVRAVLCKQEAT
jgi:hypothetical protein